MDILCLPHSILPAWHLAAVARLLGRPVLVSPSRALPDPGMARLEAQGAVAFLELPEGFSDPAALARTVAANREWARSRRDPGVAKIEDLPFSRDLPTAVRDEVRHQGEPKPAPGPADRNLAAQVFLLAARDLDASHWDSWDGLLSVARRQARLAVQMDGPDAGPGQAPDETLFEDLPDNLPAHLMDLRLKSWARLFLALPAAPRVLAAPREAVEILAETAGKPEPLFSLDLAPGFARSPGLDDFRAGMESLLAVAQDLATPQEEISRQARDLAAQCLPPGQGARLAAHRFPLGPRALFASLPAPPPSVTPHPGPTLILSLSLSPAAALALEGPGDSSVGTTKTN